ncbi:unnamed protein product [Miscanthus lutarioriparius]|uniref:Uncharacterized protein n=1 Tax=Miscanthus lutarioriparius TaxID=422564 RepID=A0A811NLJ4_9POAL|nr:unnamed protein product [Miscanthus lutarioriparius]
MAPTGPPLHVCVVSLRRRRIAFRLADGNRGAKEGRHTEEDEGEDEGDGEDRADEKDDGELQRSRQATARHGAGGSSVPALQGGDPLARLLGLWHAGPAELLGASKSLVAVAAPVLTLLAMQAIGIGIAELVCNRFRRRNRVLARALPTG